jgi:Ner family transcriptional regulator
MRTPLTTPLASDVPKEPAQRAAWVIFQLRQRNSSLAEIARSIQRTRRYLSRTLYAPSYPAEKAIADALGMTVEALFPERYDATGRRLHQRRDAKPITAVRSRNVEGEAAA